MLLHYPQQEVLRFRLARLRGLYVTALGVERVRRGQRVVITTVGLRYQGDQAGHGAPIRYLQPTLDQLEAGVQVELVPAITECRGRGR